eukprot:m.176526 g.176526  ORF g.176526 m.176526 type:complete len:53 (+) comp15445_c0_seq15:2286-2444(+)
MSFHIFQAKAKKRKRHGAVATHEAISRNLTHAVGFANNLAFMAVVSHIGIMT